MATAKERIPGAIFTKPFLQRRVRMKRKGGEFARTGRKEESNFQIKWGLSKK